MPAPTQPISGASGGGGGTDERIKVSLTDTIASYLSSKLSSHTDTPIVLNIVNPGGNEILELNLDGDQVEITWIPTTYTRNASAPEATDILDLAAHLKGIDDFLGLNDVEAVNQRLRIEKLFNSAYDDHYAEMTYVGDNLTSVDIWEDSGKTLKLFTRTLSYSGDDLTTVTTVDETTSALLTATLTYSGDNLDTVTKVVS